MSEEKIVIGWEEWCSLPDLHLPAIKAKIDTGAKTSALHAFDIYTFTRHDKQWVRFSVHPLQGNDKIVTCESLLIDQRYVMNSGGHKEYRYVISTTLVLGASQHEIELTLTDRAALSFRMLLGRAAMQGLVIIDPSKAFCQGKLKRSHLAKVYNLK